MSHTFTSASACILLVSLLCTATPIDTWCGKAYRTSDPSFDPGGRLDKPKRSPSAGLNLQIRPLVQPYLESDVTGAFIIDASLSHFHSETSEDILVDQSEVPGLNFQSKATGLSTLSCDVYDSNGGFQIIKSALVEINSTGTIVTFNLNDSFAPSYATYSILMEATVAPGHWLAATTKLLRLPNRSDGGSVTKIDNLFGALLVNDVGKHSSWKRLFPYSYYLNGNWLAKNPGNMSKFRAYGYNVLHIVPAGGLGYNFTQLDAWLDEAERVGLWIMYDMRWTYQNSSLVEWQVERLKARPNLLLWYTADEPDGQVDPLDAPQDAYNLIKYLDPYHPVSLCLNCENFHFREYATGADIILSDIYPLGTNTSWSSKYDTVCNATYGCCGCDNCVGHNNLSNVPARLDTFRQYQTQLGLPPKPLWGVPQAFGNSEFWEQTPTQQEEVVMTMLSVNHGAKGIIMWTFPTTPELVSVTSALVDLLTNKCADLILGGELTIGLTVEGVPPADVSMWVSGEWMLLSIVNPSYEDAVGLIELSLPHHFKANSVGSLWGDQWDSVDDSAGRIRFLQRTGLPGLSVDVLLLSIGT